MLLGSTLIFGSLTFLFILISILNEFSCKKSILGEMLYSPKDFWTEDLKIEYIDFSSSNFISVFVGWILTSIFSGFIDKFIKYDG